jgi:hypothetical protein
MVVPGKFFKKISDYILESADKLYRDGLLLYIKYTKGDESRVEIAINCIINDNEYVLSLAETDSIGKIIKWKRYLDESLDIIYPVSLSYRCSKIQLIIIFVNSSTNEGVIEISGGINISPTAYKL